MVSLPLVQNSGLPPTVQFEAVLTALVIPQVKVRVKLGIAFFVITSASGGQLLSLAQLWKLPKLGALRFSPGLIVSVITPPVTEQVSAGFTLLPVNVHTPSGGAVCAQSGPNVPSFRTTVCVPSGLVKLETVNERHPLSSVCVVTGPPVTPVAV